MNKTDPHNSNLDNSYLHNTDIVFAWSKALTSWPEFAAAFSSISSTACRSPFAFNGNCKTLGKRSTKKRLYQDGHMWCLLQCSVCSRELLRPHLCRHFLLAFPLHAPCLGCTRVLLLEGFCPKSAKRNGRGKERRGEGTEEARRRKGKEEREKRTGPTRVLIIPQMRCSQGTKLTHKAHFPPSGTRSSPRME